MEKSSRIFIAGHQGLVGSAIVRKLHREGFHQLVLYPREKLDLLNQSAVFHFFAREKIDYVFVAAARVGGIQVNRTYPANFIYENLTIACNLIHASAQAQVKKLLYLGSSCIYPKNAPQPMKEEYLLTGPLEPTNEAYAIAKIAGLKLCEYYSAQYGCRFIAVMPTNLYGPEDNFDLKSSHVLPALLRKFYEAKRDSSKEVIVWGSGNTYREFMHVDDLASALYLLMEKYEEKQFLNVGYGRDITIKELSEMIRRVVGFEGKVTFDTSMPEGSFRKLLDSGRMRKQGWEPKITLEDGIRSTYQWALSNQVFGIKSKEKENSKEDSSPNDTLST